jgi:glycosyltransferase involved in cell wall biosynthesis
MKLPLVSCIMPTANRHQFIPYAIDYFLHQDYQNSELIILDDGSHPVNALIPNNPKIRYYYNKIPQSIGTKRNLCCTGANGEIIIHLDDDDWYAQDWISKQVNALIESGADVTGLKDINYFSTVSNKKWDYRNSDQHWVYGGTLAYWKSFWEKHPFKEMTTGEDNEFLSNSGANIYPHDYTLGYLGILHTSNLGIKIFEDPREKLQLEKWLKRIYQPEECNLKTLRFSDFPLVSCIMPTANREDFIPSAIGNFLKQDYPNKELVIIDDGKQSVVQLVPDTPQIKYFYTDRIDKIGTKRNMACEKSNGELIMHWDDDDWYAENWISHEVHVLLNSKADICGINQVQFYSPSLNKYWMTKNSNSKRPWLTGASLIYRKSFWQDHRFKDLQIGEDDDYVRNTGAKIHAHDYFQGFIATLHPHNTSIKFFEDPKDKLPAK